eukprot:Clim_evm55s119 gene=Clim_evmTU55s119
MSFSLQAGSYFNYFKLFFKTALVPAAEKLGSPILRKVCSEVDPRFISSAYHQKVISRMKKTMHAYGAVGVSANQLGYPERMFVIGISQKLSDNVAPKYRERMPETYFDPLPDTVAINPSIKQLGAKRIRIREGCLSFQNFTAEIERHASIELKALDEKGQEYRKELHGLASIIAQHEMDHLNGIMFTDKMDCQSLCHNQHYASFAHPNLAATRRR